MTAVADQEGPAAAPAPPERPAQEPAPVPAQRRPLHGVPGNERILALSDGVFAIAITLLVLSLQVPASVPRGGLVMLLPELLPKLTGHVITFAILGIYWIAHHNMFKYVHRHDRTMLWLNNLFLLFIAAMPFPTGLIAQYGNDRFAIMAYGATLVMGGLSLEFMWLYATYNHRLVAPGLDPALIAFFHRRILVAPAVYLLAIGISFVSITAAKVLFFLVAVAYILPDPMDRFHHRQFHQSTGAEENV
jgi:uncharacterized membrane protein